MKPAPARPAETADAGSAADLLVSGARLLVTMDDERREIPGGWVAVHGGAVNAVGVPGTEPAAAEVIDASGCLVTPGLVNTHHHMYQNLTRAFAPALGGDIFHWLRVQYPIWARLDEEAAYVSAWIGCTELALGGCTTTMDHLYVHPRGGGDLIGAEIRAAAEVGMRFHATRGSMSLSEKDGGLPPDSVVQDDDEILADSQRLVTVHHDRSPHAMTQVALAPCSPFSVTPELMKGTAELAERLDVRLHTHLAETTGEDVYCLEHFGRRPIEYFEDCGWATERAWVGHVVYPSEQEIVRLGTWGTGVAHCPSSNMMIGAGLAPVQELRAAGVPVGLGCDGSASTDCASLWMEARNALLLGRLRHGGAAMRARDALEMGTRAGAKCLGREREIGLLAPGACADLVVWPLEGIAFAGALTDPVEAWLRCGPVAARHTVIGGRVVVRDGLPTSPEVNAMLDRHHGIATEWQLAAA
ncbi:MAG: 8-oxoguanine deaminase [Acidimicrobiia bacterium]